jgi:hypothetical protein
MCQQGTTRPALPSDDVSFDPQKNVCISVSYVVLRRKGVVGVGPTVLVQARQFRAAAAERLYARTRR